MLSVMLVSVRHSSFVGPPARLSALWVSCGNNVRRADHRGWPEWRIKMGQIPKIDRARAPRAGTASDPPRVIYYVFPNFLIDNYPQFEYSSGRPRRTNWAQVGFCKPIRRASGKQRARSGLAIAWKSVPEFGRHPECVSD